MGTHRAFLLQIPVNKEMDGDANYGRNVRQRDVEKREEAVLTSTK